VQDAQPSSQTPGAWGGRAALAGGALAVCAIVVVVVIVPALLVAMRIVEGVAREGIGVLAPLRLEPLAISVGFALGIGVLATCLAWPVAWRVYDRAGRWLALTLVPVFAPAYLAYAGYGLLRSPGTWLGDLVNSASARWTILTDRSLAIVSLGLWAWPIACLALCLALRRVHASVWEAQRLDPVSPMRRLAMRLGAVRAGLAASVVLVALVMLGSPTPLHLANIPTYAVELWAALAATGGDEQWRVFGASWPSVVVALASGVLVMGALRRWAARHVHVGDVEARPGRAWVAAPLLALAVSVVLPGVLLARQIETFAPVRRFVHLYDDAIVDSLRIAGMTCLGALAIGLGVSMLESAGRAWGALARALAWVLLVSAFMPGILVGDAILRAYGPVGWLRPIMDSAAIVSLGHLARFGFVPALVALWLGATSTREAVAMQRLDGADSPAGWLRATLPVHLPLLAASILAVGALSLHEIESTVMLAPAGTDSLSRSMLEFLHFARRTELSIGTLILLSGSLGLGVAILAFARRPQSSANRIPTQSIP
jgi:iron(III) transport system permease protein